jgi:hypothetical protein
VFVRFPARPLGRAPRTYRRFCVRFNCFLQRRSVRLLGHPASPSGQALVRAVDVPCHLADHRGYVEPSVPGAPHIRGRDIRVRTTYRSVRSDSADRRLRTAGPSRTAPSTSKREPWHGQSHVRSAVLKVTSQPR